MPPERNPSALIVTELVRVFSKFGVFCQALIKKLIKHPRTELTDQDCRYLGDAVFACLAPKNSVILTTNVKDHEPMAKALGKKVECP